MKPSFITLARNAPRTTCLLLALSALAGCGGHGGSTHSARGKINLNIVWPASPGGRVIPSNAQSLVVQAKQGAIVVGSTLVVRPASTATLAELPTGSLSVVATAYPNADGTGTAMALATLPTTIVANNTTNVDITLASTIDHLEVTPSPFVLGATLTDTINVVARDLNNAVVLLSPTALSFASSNSSVVSVSSAGAVTAGSSVGSATITILESDSGKSLSLPLNVVPTVTMTGGSTSLTLRATTTFTASVVGPSNTSVIWSVLEGASGGTITAGGLYTAPATHGNYHVVATSAADPSRTATATVAISSGSLGVTVH